MSGVHGFAMRYFVYWTFLNDHPSLMLAYERFCTLTAYACCCGFPLTEAKSLGPPNDKIPLEGAPLKGARMWADQHNDIVKRTF